jgi:hypothetical protein
MFSKIMYVFFPHYTAMNLEGKTDYKKNRWILMQTEAHSSTVQELTQHKF